MSEKETTVTPELMVEQKEQETTDTVAKEYQNPYFEGNPFGDVPVFGDGAKENIEKAKQAVLDFIEANKDTETISKLSSTEKDELFAKSEEVLKGFLDSIKNAQYNLPLLRKECKCIIDLIESKIDYDVNDLFLAIRLEYSLLPVLRSLKFQNPNTTVQVPSLNVDTVAILFHLLQKHTVKGLNDASLTFAMVIRKLGEIKKESYVFEQDFEVISKMRNGWAASMEVDNTTPEQSESEVKA